MLRLRYFGFLATSCLILGCTRPAPVPHRISFEDIIHKVHCELHHAVWKSNYVPRRAQLHARRNTPWDFWWSNWKAGIQLKIQTDKDADLSSTADFTAPIHRGRFSLGLIGSFKKQATNSTTFNFDVYMDELGPRGHLLNDRKSTYLFNPSRCSQLEGQRGRLLAGNLGLTDWLQRAAGAYNETGVSSTGQVYFVKFVITLNGSAKPGFNITSPTGETYSVTVTAGGKRVRTHELTVTLAKIRPDTESEDVIALNSILESMKAQLAELKKIRDNTRRENAFLDKNLTENERKLIENQKIKEDKSINDLESNINKVSSELQRMKSRPSSSADGRIRELQLLDAISRIDTNN